MVWMEVFGVCILTVPYLELWSAAADDNLETYIWACQNPKPETLNPKPETLNPKP